MKFYKTEKGHYYKNLNSIKQRIGEAEYLKYKNSNAKKYQDIEFDEKRFRKVMVGGAGCSWCGIASTIVQDHMTWCPRHKNPYFYKLLPEDRDESKSFEINILEKYEDYFINQKILLHALIDNIYRLIYSKQGSDLLSSQACHDHFLIFFVNECNSSLTAFSQTFTQATINGKILHMPDENALEKFYKIQRIAVCQCCGFIVFKNDENTANKYIQEHPYVRALFDTRILAALIEKYNQPAVTIKLFDNINFARIADFHNKNRSKNYNNDGVEIKTCLVSEELGNIIEGERIKRIQELRQRIQEAQQARDAAQANLEQKIATRVAQNEILRQLNEEKREQNEILRQLIEEESSDRLSDNHEDDGNDGNGSILAKIRALEQRMPEQNTQEEPEQIEVRISEEHPVDIQAMSFDDITALRFDVEPTCRFKIYQYAALMNPNIIEKEAMRISQTKQTQRLAAERVAAEPEVETDS